MRIVRARIRDVLCFAGEHELELEPKVYALVASYEGEEGRSNWGGKSALLRALGPLPLFGWHGRRLEDDWISDGADEAEAELEFDDGTRVRRWRKRSGSTQCEVVVDGKVVGQKGAVEAIETRLRLSKDDFFATRFVRQKDVDRLFNSDKTKPSDRHELVAGWFDLGGLVRCEEAAGADLAKANRELADLERDLGATEALVAKLEETTSGADADERVRALREKARAARAEAEALHELSTRVERVRIARAAKAELAEVEACGKRLSAEVKAFEAPDLESLEREFERARERSRIADEKVSRLRVLARGEFDGACPVADGFQCPAKASINAEASKHRGELEAAQEPARATRGALELARQKLSAGRETERAQEAAKGELARLGDRWKELKRASAGADDPLPEGDPRAEAMAWMREAADAEAEAGQIERARSQVADARRRADEVRAKIATVRARRDRVAEAAFVFGRQGAQRRCSETYLARIESGANDLLASAGVDLRVRASWGREGQGLARACDRCGEAFPNSAKIKQCGRCGAARGANVVERLDLDVDVRSDGGATDLGGLAMQLAAGSWLASRRGSPFSVAYLDEPLAAVDAANRGAITRSLVGMLTGRYGLEQSFVVAHSPDALDACPGRIEVVVGRDGRRSIRVS